MDQKNNKEREFIYASNAYSNGCNTHHIIIYTIFRRRNNWFFILFNFFYMYLVIILKTLKNKIKQLSFKFSKKQIFICGSILVELFPLYQVKFLIIG